MWTQTRTDIFWVMTELAAFGRELRRLRTSAGLSQEQLAERSGVSVRTIRSLEKASARRPRPSTVGRLADALDLTGDRRRTLLAQLDPDDDGAAPMLSPTLPSSGAADLASMLSTGSTTPADLLLTMRSRLAWTQQTLATKAGLHLRTISDLERGVTAAAQPATARRIALAAGFEGAELADIVAVLTGGRTHLPGIDRLIGRRDEIDRVLALLDRHALVAITGPGGIGKTALALAVAAGYPGDVRVLELADIEPGTPLPLALLTVLGLDDVEPGAAPDSDADLATGAAGAAIADAVADAVADAIASHDLVVVDNVEHLTAIGETLDRLAGRDDTPILLTTSRLPLDTERGVDIALDPLQPDDAVTLLRRRAERSDSLPAWSDDGPYREIGAAVDHLPLALELVTSWSPVLSPVELLDRLRAPLTVVRRSDGAGGNESADRHHSVRSVVGWTLDLVSDPSRTLFAELSVHPASFTVDMAEHVHGDIAPVLDSIRELADAGLIHIDGEHRPTRVRIAPVIRDVAAELFTDQPRRSMLLDRRTEWVLSLVAVTNERLISRYQQEWLERLDRERPHLDATLQHLQQMGSIDAVAVAAGLWRYWHLRSLYRLGAERIGAAVTIAGAAESPMFGTARYGQAVMAYLQGDVESTTTYAHEALDIYTRQGDAHGRASIQSLLGMVAQFLGQVAESERWYRTGLAEIDASRNERALVTLSTNLASLLAQEGRFAEAIELAEEMTARYESLGDERGAADHLGNLGWWFVAAGDPHRARVALSEVRDVYARLGEPAAVAESDAGLAEAALYLHELEQAEHHLEQAERQLDDVDEPWVRSLMLALRATLTLLSGRPEPALRLARRSLHLADQLPYANAQLRAHLAESVARTMRGDRVAALRSAEAALRLCGAGNPGLLATAVLLVTTISPEVPAPTGNGAGPGDGLRMATTTRARSLPAGPPAVFDLVWSLDGPIRSDAPEGAGDSPDPPPDPPLNDTELAAAALARIERALVDQPEV